MTGSTRSRRSARARGRFAVAAAVLAGMMTTTACTAGFPGSNFFADDSGADRVMKGVPADWDGPDPDLLNGQPIVGWVSDTEFGIVTVGSSSCPAVAGELEVVGADALQIEFEPSSRDPCTADMAATTHVFELRPEVTGRPLTVTVRDAGNAAEYVLRLE